MLVTVEKEVDLNGWGHVGHFIQNICLSSLEFGLGNMFARKLVDVSRNCAKNCKFQ